MRTDTLGAILGNGSMAAAAVLAAGLTGSTFAGPVTPQPKMGDPLPGLTPGQLVRFNVGRERFNHTFFDAEGLGPVFNKESCGNCHTTGKVTGGPGSIFVIRAGVAEKDGFDPLADYGGSLFQIAAINEGCLEVVPEVANVEAHRVTNGVMGYGLVEAIPDAQIYAVRDAQPLNVRGEAHEVGSFEDEVIRVGRFGWKAQVATILTFSADASLNEIGLTSVFLPDENDPNGIFPPTLAECDEVPDPEDSVALGNGVDRTFIQTVTDFQRYLAAPPQTPKSGMTGEGIFMSIGCGQCHHPQYTTSNDKALERAIRNKTIRPYTDFLLHNMGLNADGIVQGEGTEFRLKTPPLSGLRLRPALWHSGDVLGSGLNEYAQFDDRVRQAIARHDDGTTLSQGRFAKQAFDALDEAQKAQVIQFLSSLGLSEFDHDANFNINIRDFADFGHLVDFASCFGGGPYTPDDPCAIHDIDQDTAVGYGDYTSFLAVYEEVLYDCDADGVEDLREILDGTQVDANDDGIPDACAACPSDTDGNGTTNVADLVNVIVNWGPCPAAPDVCVGDVNRDGKTDVQDLVAVITGWGVCD